MGLAFWNSKLTGTWQAKISSKGELYKPSIEPAMRSEASRTVDSQQNSKALLGCLAKELMKIASFLLFCQYEKPTRIWTTSFEFEPFIVCSNEFDFE